MPVHVELVGDRIELRGSAGPATQTLAKAIPKASYRVRPDKHWRYPVTVATCRALRNAFGAELVIGPELNEWARVAIAQAERVVELRGAEAAELTNVPRYAPRIAQAMAARTYQQVGAAFIADAGNCMITDQPGLGKTIQVLGGIIEREGPEVGLHLILCPRLAVPLVWGRQIEHWLGERGRVFTLQGTRAERVSMLQFALRSVSDKHDVFVVGNIEMARALKDERGKFPSASKFKPEMTTWPDLFAVEWDTVVADESHRAVIKASGDPSATRVGFTRLKAKHKIAMSGTPMRGKPHQLWGTLNWLRPREFSNYWDWVGKYWATNQGFFGGIEIGGYQPGGRDRLARDLQDVSLRRTKVEVAPELPPKLYSGVHLIPGDDNSPLADWLEMTPKQARQYKRLREDATLYGASGSKSVNGHLAMATREKQIAGSVLDVDNGDVFPVDVDNSPKFEWLVNLLDSLGIEPDNEGEPSAKVIVASQFTKLLEVFAADLRSMGYALHLLTGNVTSDKKREAMCNDFQSEESTARIILINTSVAGVAIELDAADDLVILDESYIPDDQEQLEDRAHRISRVHQLTVHKPKMLGTIEEEVAFVNAARQDEQSYILDGVRGVEVARRIYEQSKAD